MQLVRFLRVLMERFLMSALMATRRLSSGYQFQTSSIGHSAARVADTNNCLSVALSSRSRLQQPQKYNMGWWLNFMDQYETRHRPRNVVAVSDGRRLSSVGSRSPEAPPIVNTKRMRRPTPVGRVADPVKSTHARGHQWYSSSMDLKKAASQTSSTLKISK